MKTSATPSAAKENDILSVLRELDPERRAQDDRNVSEAREDTPDPVDLLNSLRKKAELVKLLDGHKEAKGVIAMREELQEAIDFLEGLTKTPNQAHASPEGIKR